MRGEGLLRSIAHLWRWIVGRGQKKMTLRDLSSGIIEDEHIPDIIHELDNQTDRGAALVAAALIDATLTRAVAVRLVGFKDFKEIIFEKEGAPLGSLFAKTKMARALGVLGPVTEGHTDAIRRIRNQFAHSALKIDFTNPLIATEVDKLLPDANPEWKPEFTPERRRYIGTCIMLIQALEARIAEHLEDKFDVWLP